jgi:hypothetical protein
MHDGVWIDGVARALATRLTRRGALQAAATGAAAVALRSVPAKAGAQCEDSSTCDGGTFCSVAGECIEDGTCVNDEDCPGGERCFPESVCATPECEFDGDCGAGEVCSGYVCVPDPSIECVEDLDCAQDEVCDANVCVPAPSGCSDDEDCAPDEICDVGVCVPSARPCQVDDDCASDGICLSGICAPVVDAPGNGDCENEVCTMTGVHTLPNTGAAGRAGSRWPVVAGAAAVIGALAMRVRGRDLQQH